MAGLIVKVKYACVDSMHLFTAGDALSKGLFVGSKDFGVAYKEVAYQLNYLFEKNLKRKTKFNPGVSLEDFEKWIAAQSAASKKSKPKKLQPIPSANVEWAAAA